MRLLLLTALFSYAAACPAAPISFVKQIAPILADQCLECHRADKVKGSYRLDTFEQLMKPGDSEEPPLIPGKAEASLLHHLLVTDDDADRMPKKADPLPAGDIALIKQWITEGAKFDGPNPKSALTSLLPEKHIAAPAKYPRPIPVTALALNGDAKVLLTSGYHEVLAWDPDTGKLRARIPNLPERILGLSFIKGGPWFAVAGGIPGRSGEIWIVNYAKPTERRRLAQLRDCALCAVTTPDGTRLITGGADNRVRCFSLPDGRALWDIEMHADWILGLAVSPDGKHIATAGRDRTARCVETDTGIIEGTFTGHSVPVLSVAFSPDGQEVLSGGADGAILRWGLAGTGKKDTSLKTPGRSEALALAFLDQNTPVTATGAGLVSAFDAKSRKIKTTVTTHADRVNALLPFGPTEARRLITASHDGQLRITSPTEPKELLKFTASPGW